VRRINYTSIRKTLTSQLEGLKGQARKLDDGDIDTVIATLKKLRRLWPDAEAWRVNKTGGYVSNSYKWRAQADLISLIVTNDGTHSARAYRGWAQSRAGGVGNTLRGHVTINCRERMEISEP